MEVFRSAEELEAALGRELGPTPWQPVDQQQVDTFADLTGDHQWIHVDPVRAASGPFGATVAHGFLTLSLIPHLLHGLRTIEFRMGVNYGLNRVRFPAPVRVGNRIRGRAVTTALDETGDGGVQLTTVATVEVEGTDRPGCVAELLGRYYF